MNDEDSYSNIDKARYHLGLARDLLARGGEHWKIVNRIYAVFNRIRDEWLIINDRLSLHGDSEYPGMKNGYAR